MPRDILNCHLGVSHELGVMKTKLRFQETPMKLLTPFRGFCRCDLELFEKSLLQRQDTRSKWAL